MPLTRKPLIEQIELRLDHLSQRIKGFTGNGLNDAAKFLEPFAARLLNAAYGWNLKDPAPGVPNTKGIDLTDDTNHVAVQVSVQEPAEKIKHTAAMLSDGKYAGYKIIAIFFLHSIKHRDDHGLSIINIPTLIGNLMGKDIPVLENIIAILKAETAPLPEQEKTDASGTASILNLLHVHMAKVKSTLAKGLTCAVPRAEIPEASQLFGRGDDLTKLRALLRSHHRVAVTGPGGLGKTALCAALVKGLEAEAADEGRALLHAGLFAHDFYKRPSLADFVSSILEQAGLVCEEATHQPALAALVLRRPGVMLYIEGAEKLTQAAALLEFLDDHICLILTTRDPRQAETLTEHPLEPLEFRDAAEAIHHYAAIKPRKKSAGPWPHGLEKSGWELLARDLGGHPLACRLAGELCAAHTLDPAALHDQLGRQSLHPLLRGEDSKKNLHILFRQSALTVQTLSPGDDSNPSPALTAWHCLTLDGTSPVPFSILEAFGVKDQKDLAPLLDLGLAWSTSVAAEQPGTQEPAYALTHALLGEWARSGLAEFGCYTSRLLESAMQWGEKFRDRVQYHGRVPGGPERYLAVISVAEALLREVEALPELPPDALYEFYYLPARMHRVHARHLAAETLYRRGLEMLEQSAGPDASSTAAALNNLAHVLQATHRMTQAEPLMRRALAIDEACFGSDHPELAIDLNNLAQLLQATHRMAEAEPLLRRALAIDETSFGSDHPKMAIRLNNLAGLLQATQRLVEAEPLLRRALAIFETSYGTDHPNVAVNLNNLARLLQATNRMEEAEPLLRRAVVIDETSFGSDHPEVARDLNNLALLLWATDRLSEAEPLMWRGVKIFVAFTAATGHPHSRLTDAAKNYTKLLMAIGDPEEQAHEKVSALLAPVRDKLRLS
jgi:tetratricopeptide (TPR) repeat protein